MSAAGITVVEHVPQVGDLCMCTYAGTGHGIIYRVASVGPTTASPYQHRMLVIVPVHGVIATLQGRGKRTIPVRYCKFVGLVELAAEYARLGTFIADEARRRGADGTATDA